jgi:hypothetical protein
VKLFKLFRLPALIALSLSLLVACFIPEQFDAKIAIASDGSYKFTYDGTLAFALALKAAQSGMLSVKADADLQKLVAELKKDSTFKKVEYLGKARYKVLVEKLGKPGEPYYFMSQQSKIISVVPQKDGSISIAAIKLNQNFLQELSFVSSKIDGTLSVTLENGVKVMQHNATSEPSFFGLFGSYKWQIKSPDMVPMMVVKIK